MHSKIKFFNQKPTNEIGRPHYTPLVIYIIRGRSPKTQFIYIIRGRSPQNAIYTYNLWQLTPERNLYI